MISLARTFTRRSLRGVTPLIPLVFLIALFAALLLHAGRGPAFASQLFQSPVSPAQQPAPPPPPAPKPTRPPAAQPTQPAAQPKPERVLPPTVPAPAGQPTQPAVPPTQPPAPPTQPPVPPTATQPPPPAAAPTEAPPQEVTPIQRVAPPVVPGEETQPGSGEVVIDSGLLIDSILVYASYAWLCCGILLFIFIPIAFIGLYIWGAQRRKNANGRD
jgi:hypothetical protein